MRWARQSGGAVPQHGDCCRNKLLLRRSQTPQDFRSDPTILRYAVTGFDANYVTLGASVDIRFRNDTSAFVGIETILGHAYIRGTIFQVGFRAILFYLHSL